MGLELTVLFPWAPLAPGPHIPFLWEAPSSFLLFPMRMRWAWVPEMGLLVFMPGEGSSFQVPHKVVFSCNG